jgi:hypothetical protein
MSRRGRTADAVRPDVLGMTSVADDRTHLITAAAFDDGTWRGAGWYRAVCGATVVASSMSAIPGPDCRPCHQPERGVV